jgi:ethanolamine utilization protein
MIVEEVLKRINGLQLNGQSLKTNKILILDSKREKDYEYITTAYINTVFLDDFCNEDSVGMFDYIIVPKLTNHDLGSIAMGLEQSDVSCIVIEGIFHGKTIIVMEEGIVYRKFKETSNPNFYKMFETYENKLVSFGIHVIKKQNICEYISGNVENKQIVEKTSIAECQAVAVDKRVIVENDVCKVFSKGYKTMHIHKNSIVTPLALDYIRRHEMSIVKK